MVSIISHPRFGAILYGIECNLVYGLFLMIQFSDVLANVNSEVGIVTLAQIRVFVNMITGTYKAERQHFKALYTAKPNSPI